MKMQCRKTGMWALLCLPTKFPCTIKGFTASLLLLMGCFHSSGQTFQNTNALSQKTGEQRYQQFKDVDTLKKISTDWDTADMRLLPLSAKDVSASKEQIKSVDEYAGKVGQYLNGDKKIPEAVRLKMQNSINEITDQTDLLKKELDKLDETNDAVERSAITNRIKRVESTLLKRKEELVDLQKKHSYVLSKNQKLSDEIEKMNNSLKEVGASLVKKDQELLRYAKTIYILRLKLNEPGLEGIFRKYTNVYAKFNELKIQLDSVNWFVERSFSPEDAQPVINGYKELNRKFALIIQAKAKQESDSAAFSQVLETYKKLDVLFGKDPEKEPSQLAAMFDKLDGEVDKKYKAAAASFKALENEINNYILIYKEKIAVINPILAKYSKKESKEQHYAVFGGFKKILEEEGAFIPEINVFANKKFGDPNFGGYGQIRLFTGAGINSKNVNTKYNFFVPEASSFGISLDMGLGFGVNTSDGKPSKNGQKGIKDIGINTGLYLMGKNLNVTDSLTVKPNVALWKTGLEMLPFQNFFSLRVNINGLFTTNRLIEMEKYYSTSNTNYWYTDLAFSALLDIKGTENFKLKFDLNLTFLTQSMRTFLETDDKVLPQVKLELVSTF